jgi:hypothetical protein
MKLLQILARPSFEANLPRFYLAQALYNFMFFMPIWVIFLQQKHGLTLTQVTIVDFAFWITMAITEVPTGAVADTIGRKYSLLIGSVLSIFSVLLFGLAPTYPLLLVANSLWGIALTFISGADMAFFYDTLRVLGRTGEYTRLRGHLAAISLGAGGVGSALGGLLAERNMTSPFVLYAGALVLNLLVYLQLKEPPGEESETGGKRTSYAVILRTAWDEMGRKPALRYMMLYSNLMPLANWLIMITFIQPHALAIGVPLGSLGILIFSLSLVRIAGSTYAGKVTGFFGERRWLSLAPLFVTAGVLGLALVPSLLGVAIFTIALFASVASRPLIEDIMLREVPGTIRATILSVDNLIMRLILAGVEPLVGITADRWGLPTSLGLLGLGSAFVLILVVVGLLRAMPRQIQQAPS